MAEAGTHEKREQVIDQETTSVDQPSTNQEAQETLSTAPPLPDESPPLPEEAPPLPEEAPPLPEEAPPLPEETPPLPEEAPPTSEAPPLPDEQPPDDGWAPVWDATAQAYYFYNRFTQVSQWDNPRVPEATSAYPSSTAPGMESRSSGAPGTSSPAKPSGIAGGYNPAIHGNFDPDADYAIGYREEYEEPARAPPVEGESDPYAAKGAFNRFTGKWQNADLTPETFSDHNKAKRQMNAYFDIDTAANSHEGKSLKAERQNKKLSKKEVQAYNQKRKAKKEEKRRAWLMD